ncbi:MAG: primosomal protein N', partial [Turneriella sp.]|nr:primosomal protein N' [Turneriella sp.]
GKQVLLLFNRRGHSTHVYCDTCAQFAECPHCSVTLTYHKDGSLRCHFCGYHESFRPDCPKDGNRRRLFGRAIQRLEDIIEQQFPQVPYARLDRDTAQSGKFAAEVFEAMRAQKISILIGTQMVAKGIDLPGITLVGILGIDSLLNAPDFRAAERVWQLLTQVIGRSGRHEPGEVVIQTMEPQNSAIVAAARHDPEIFYTEEARNRLLAGYPPFKVLARILLLGKSEKPLLVFAEKLVPALKPQNLAGLFGTHLDAIELLGPAVPGHSRLEQEYRLHFLIKASDEEALHGYLANALPIVSKELARTKGIRYILDIDPRETD